MKKTHHYQALYPWYHLFIGFCQCISFLGKYLVPTFSLQTLCIYYVDMNKAYLQSATEHCLKKVWNFNYHNTFWILTFKQNLVNKLLYVSITGSCPTKLKHSFSRQNPELFCYSWNNHPLNCQLNRLLRQKRYVVEKCINKCVELTQTVTKDWILSISYIVSVFLAVS